MTLLSAIPGFQLSHPSHTHCSSFQVSCIQFEKMICSRGRNSVSVIQVGSLCQAILCDSTICKAFQATVVSLWWVFCGPLGRWKCILREHTRAGGFGLYQQVHPQWHLTFLPSLLRSTLKILRTKENMTFLLTAGWPWMKTMAKSKGIS